MIETADDTAVDEEASSLEQNEPDHEVGSRNRQAPPLQAPGAGAGPVLHLGPAWRVGDPIAGGHPGAGGPEVYCCHISRFCPGMRGGAAPGAIFL